ncbi:MAG: radical SAM protein [uncultured bacterium]|nr:MAG: radical SAM protein [uncultured bacterium]
MKKKYNFPVIYIETTRRCNLKCPACMSGSNKKAFVESLRNNELSYDEIVNLILKPSLSLGTKHIYLSGGEFLLREDALDILKAVIDIGYYPKIATNGTLINEELLSKIKKIAGRKIVLAFGIDSICDLKINKKTRSMEVNKILNNLELCKKYRIAKHVVINAASYSCKTFEATLAWLEKNKIPFNRVPFVPRNSGSRFSRWCISKKEMEKYIFPALNKRINGYFSFIPFFLSPELHSKYSKGKFNVTVPQNPSIGCWVGSWVAISAEGDVSPCTILLDKVVAGNVRNQTIYDIIDKSEIFQTILDRNKLKGKCGKCRYQFTCGGCRGLAYYKTGDYMEEDPTCFFEPIDKNTKSQFEDETNNMFKKYIKLARFAGMYKD